MLPTDCFVVVVANRQKLVCFSEQFPARLEHDHLPIFLSFVANVLLKNVIAIFQSQRSRWEEDTLLKECQTQCKVFCDCVRGHFGILEDSTFSFVQGQYQVKCRFQCISVSYSKIGYF